MTVLPLRTDDGVVIAADVADPDGPPDAAAVLLHPHPLMGGDRTAPVPAHLFSHLPAEGISALRFDFRGAGGSGGSHGGGEAEVADVRAAVTRAHEHTGAPVWLVGWSFGADVSLLCTHEAVAGWVCVTPPLSLGGIGGAAGVDPRTKLVLVAEHDQFCPPVTATERCARWENTEVRVIRGADHFLAGHLGAVAVAVRDALLGGPGPHAMPVA